MNIKGSISLADLSDSNINFNWSEYKLARDRVGSNNTEATEWLIQFSQKDLKQLSFGDWANLRYETIFFFNIGLPLKGRLTTGEWNDQIYTSIRHIPSDKEVEKFQGWVRDAIDHIIKKEPVYIDLSPMTICLAPPDKKESWYKISSTKDPWTTARFFIIPLFIEFAHRIRRCPGCQIIFLADRINQQFCTANCQSRHYMRNVKGVSPERYGKRGRPPGTGKKKERPSKAKGGSHGKTKRKGQGDR